MVGALAGVHVLDLTRFPPGGYCTVMLSDLGADVCRVDSPHQTGRSLAVALGRGKRSVGLDLRHERSVEVLRRLAAWADVLVEGERPGAMDERGFGYSVARAENPALIWCSISGYGQDGPYAKYSGHDLSYLAHSGMLAALDPELPWHPQGILAIPVGALMAVVGILAALRERDATNEGCHLDISMSESATWLLSGSDAQVNGQPVDFPTGPDRHLYQCSDGRWVAVAAAEPRTWRALCEGLGLADLVDTLHSWEEPSNVIARVAAVFLTRPAAAWVAELGPAGAAVVAANRGAELQDDPQLQARTTLQAVGDVMVPRNPIRTRDARSERPAAPPSPPSPLFADTRAVLTEAGLARGEIDSLVADGVVAESSAA